jgi:hypothetical protein
LLQSDSLPYHLVYTLPRDTYTPRALLALLGVPLFVAGRALRHRVTAVNVWDWLGQLGLPVGLQFAGITLVFAFFLLPSLQAASLMLRLARGHFVTVQGVVVDFIPGDPDDHVRESWAILDERGRHAYAYGPAAVAPGFDRTQPHGGPIRAGLRVRVADVDGHIARLEVAP